jgi:DNA-binding CsgD family transcriptional regulator
VAVLVPIQTLQRSVRLVGQAYELTCAEDFATLVLPELARLVGSELVAYNGLGAGQIEDVETSEDSPLIGIAFNHTSRKLSDVDRAVLGIMLGPLQDALRVVRLRQQMLMAAVPATPHLSARERMVLELVAAGRTNAAIAHDLGISPRTVAKHLEHVYRKLGVANRAEAVARGSDTALDRRGSSNGRARAPVESRSGPARQRADER